MPKALGIIKFAKPLYCAADSLGQIINIALAGIDGKLTLPSLPEWDKNKTDPLHKPLLGPKPARAWKRGEKLINWGSPTSYPTGTAMVELALFEFDLESDHYDTNVQKIYEAFETWLNLFEDYVKLITKQSTNNSVSGDDRAGRLELLFEEDSNLKHISDNSPTKITLQINDGDESLHLEQFKQVAHLASNSFKPHLHYRMLLESYAARRNKDYRKATIEAAAALEVCLTMRIMEELNTQNISFGKKLLQKFRMLGGRFELARLLEINLPDKDYVSLVMTPRNNVIHRASFPDPKLANQVITEVEELLHLFSPQLHEEV